MAVTDFTFTTGGKLLRARRRRVCRHQGRPRSAVPAPPPRPGHDAARSDEWIIEHSNDLTATLWFLTQHAIDHNDWGWLTRHHWWLQAATRLNRGEPSTALDG